MGFNYQECVSFGSTILKRVGVDSASAEAVSEGVCEASLRGVDSHGIRLLPHYIESARLGRKNGKPSFKLRETYPGTLSIDADNAFGLAAGRYAVKQGMLRADKLGVCVVSVKNSSHPGAMASTSLFAARAGYMCFGFTNADALILSTNGTRPFFGTNPICFAAPRQHEDPFCVDMALSKVPWNKILLHKANDEQLPEGIAADKDGNQTLDPAMASSLFAAGGYKGFALAAMVELLCGVISGENFGRDIPPMYKAPMSEGRNLSQFYIVIKPDITLSMDDYFKQMAAFSDAIRAEPSVPDERVVAPNDPQIETARMRTQSGIPIDPVTLEFLEKVSREYGVPFPRHVEAQRQNI